ncbi:Glycine-rich RNA-binding protein 4 mitochondrial [Bienertia sinuspersici]
MMLNRVPYCRRIICPSAMLQLVRNASTNLFVGDVDHFPDSLTLPHFNCFFVFSLSIFLTHQVSTMFFVCDIGLSYDTNETVLRDTFMQHGEIIEVRVICHHVTGNSKGYGFVKFACENSAASALKEMDGQELDRRNIRVQYAHKQ